MTDVIHFGTHHYCKGVLDRMKAATAEIEAARRDLSAEALVAAENSYILTLMRLRDELAEFSKTRAA